MTGMPDEVTHTQIEERERKVGGEALHEAYKAQKAPSNRQQGHLTELQAGAKVVS